MQLIHSKNGEQFESSLAVLRARKVNEGVVEIMAEAVQSSRKLANPEN
jgi:hypothetical protein